MRFRLIFLAALVLGLSRLAFPAVTPADSLKVRKAAGNRQFRARSAGKHSAGKHSARVRPQRRFAPPARKQQWPATPVISAPTILQTVTDPQPAPRSILAMMPIRLVAARPVLKLRRSFDRLSDFKPVARDYYWTPERATAATTASSAPARVSSVQAHAYLASIAFH